MLGSNENCHRASDTNVPVLDGLGTHEVFARTISLLPSSGVGIGSSANVGSNTRGGAFSDSFGAGAASAGAVGGVFAFCEDAIAAP